MNNLFAYVKSKDNPSLRRTYIAITGDPDARHEIILMDTVLSHPAPVAERTIYTEVFLKSQNQGGFIYVWKIQFIY